MEAKKGLNLNFSSYILVSDFHQSTLSNLMFLLYLQLRSKNDKLNQNNLGLNIFFNIGQLNFISDLVSSKIYIYI